MNVTAQVELSIHPQEICFITNLKEEGQTHYLPAHCYCTHRHCDGRPEEVGTGNEADVSAERLIFSLIDTETTCSYAPAAGLAAVTKSTQSH